MVERTPHGSLMVEIGGHTMEMDRTAVIWNESDFLDGTTRWGGYVTVAGERGQEQEQFIFLDKDGFRMTNKTNIQFS